MNAPATTASKAQQFGVCQIKGRVSGVRKAGKQFLHLLTMPAPDEYSSPQTVEILSLTRLGDVNDQLTVSVRIGGYRRQYKTTDPDTGEIVQRQTADNKLFAVEA